MGAPLAAEQLDIPDHFDSRGARKPDRPMRRRMGQRNTGREHERRNPAPVELAQVLDRNAGTCRTSDAVLAVVPAHHIGPAGGERAGSNHPGAAQAEGVTAHPHTLRRCHLLRRRHPTPDCLRQSDPPPPGEGGRTR